MMISILIMILFIIPVFTGQVVNIGNVTGFLCGLFLYMLCRTPALMNEVWVKLLIGLLSVCVLIGARLTCRMIKACARKPHKGETLIILGCEIMGEKPSLMQVERLEAGLKYLHENPHTKVICSGGQGKNEKISEAAAMKIWLMNHGIEEERILLEDTSVSTEENIRNCAKIMADLHMEPAAAICTNEFHIYRALCMAEDTGLACTALCAPTAWWLIATFHVRELYAILFYMLKTKRRFSSDPGR